MKTDMRLLGTDLYNEINSAGDYYTINQIKIANGKASSLDVQALMLGDIALVGVGGEVFNEILANVKAHAPFAKVVPCGYTWSWKDYIPSYAAFHDGLGGYEIDRTPYNDQIEGIVVNSLLTLLNNFGGPGKELLTHTITGATASNAGASNPASAAIDGEAAPKWTTKWTASTSTFPKWLQLDLGATKWVSKVVINSGGYRRWEAVKDFEIRVSDDPQLSTYKVAYADNGNSTNIIACWFTPVRGRYVRLHILAGYGDTTVSEYPAIYDIKVQGPETVSIAEPRRPGLHPAPSTEGSLFLYNTYGMGLKPVLDIKARQVSLYTIRGVKLCHKPGKGIFFIKYIW